MVASHLTACMRNDKMGEASVLQNQTTVSCCPPLLSGAPSHFLSLPLLRSLSVLVCCVVSAHPCTTPCKRLHQLKSHCQCRRSRDRCYGYLHTSSPSAISPRATSLEVNAQGCVLDSCFRQRQNREHLVLSLLVFSYCMSSLYYRHRLCKSFSLTKGS